jgi:hypothetical protein
MIVGRLFGNKILNVLVVLLTSLVTLYLGYMLFGLFMGLNFLLLNVYSLIICTISLLVLLIYIDKINEQNIHDGFWVIADNIVFFLVRIFMNILKINSKRKER